MTTDNPKNKTGKLEFGGYGYHQFIDGTEFAVSLVEEADSLPPVQSTYLQEMIQAIRDFGNSRIYALMHGPIYVIDSKFKTREEKPPYLPVPRFRPSVFKWLPTLIFLSIVSGLLYFFQNMLVELGGAHLYWLWHADTYHTDHSHYHAGCQFFRPGFCDLSFAETFPAKS